MLFRSYTVVSVRFISLLDSSTRLNFLVPSSIFGSPFRSYLSVFIVTYSIIQKAEKVKPYPRKTRMKTFSACGIHCMVREKETVFYEL